MRRRTWMTPAARRRPVSPVPLAIAVLLSLTACSAGGAAICASVGGTYAAGVCTRAGHEAAAQECQARGGVYLTGQDICAVGAGGP